MKIKSYLFGVFVSLAAALPASGQTPDLPILRDTAVRIGVLDNGMTYYLRHHPKPAGMAEFCLINNAGSVNEEDSQIGLARFIEHMAFNGTKNLPDKQLVNYLESIGVRVGSELRAVTGHETTGYMLSHVPVTRESVTDSVLLILHDWAHFISLDAKSIDRQRDAYFKKVRSEDNAHRRIRERTLPVVYNNNEYGFRNAASGEEQLRKLSHEDILGFYHRWYRPDLQLIVIVGDFDVDDMVAKLKKAMSDIPAVQDPVKKEYAAIPDNEEPLVAVETDPELTESTVTIYMKRPASEFEENNTLPVTLVNYAIDGGIALTNQRLAAVAAEPDAPFVEAHISNMNLSYKTDAIVGVVSAREGGIDRALEAFYTEIEKVRRFGFSEEEGEDYKSTSMVKAGHRFRAQNERESADFVQNYIDGYLRNASIPSAQVTWNLDTLIFTKMMTEKLSDLFSTKIPQKNNVVIVTAPKKKGVAVPSPAEILAIIRKVREAEIEP